MGSRHQLLAYFIQKQSRGGEGFTAQLPDYYPYGAQSENLQQQDELPSKKLPSKKQIVRLNSHQATVRTPDLVISKVVASIILQCPFHLLFKLFT